MASFYLCHSTVLHPNTPTLSDANTFTLRRTSNPCKFTHFNGRLRADQDLRLDSAMSQCLRWRWRRRWRWRWQRPNFGSGSGVHNFEFPFSKKKGEFFGGKGTHALAAHWPSGCKKKKEHRAMEEEEQDADKGKGLLSVRACMCVCEGLLGRHFIYAAWSFLCDPFLSLALSMSFTHTLFLSLL